ncbi:protein of unknown function [Sterolibacterium denitrificans]|uniref:Uncharacterized protein n=1 Tax=Sterolibacterium denitrificans TaxID=157592 RepID=A0A7Z7MU83_9PROT|nr:hypothetical protein [Sterolibacterium denitrificans]SMB22082.1 protein of unknown function [Sterolibacterium denitrificans]
MQHLALAFHRANASATTARTAERRNLIPQLRELANQLAATIREGSPAQARRLAHQYILPPIAWGFLASCLQQQNISAEVIVGVLS